MKLTRVLLFCAAVVSLAGTVSAGTTGKIAGTVKDAQTGEALIGASVVIQGTSMGAASNVEGYYAILNVAPGKYTLVISAVGYQKQAVTDVSVSIDLTTKIDVSISSTVVDVGEEVVVTAQRPVVKKDLTSSEARVDASTIETLPVQEVSEVLTLQAGITVGKGGEIHIRGGRSSEVAYWVDGISVSDVYDGGQAVEVDNNSVQELQVISGTFNAEYGQAMSGIINIVTKDGGSQYHGNISGYTGDYVTSQGWSFNNRLFYTGSNPPPESYNSSDIYYNLNKIKPFANHNLEGSLNGPFPFLPNLSFYVSGRYYVNDGYLYGDNLFNPIPFPNGSASPTFSLTPDRFVFNSLGQVIGVHVPDNPMAMNNRKRLSGQAKLTYQFGGWGKLSLTGVGHTIHYRDYSHDWFLNPDGDVRKFDDGYDGSALWTHTLTASSFYTVNLSFLDADFQEHLYDTPTDPRYYVADPNVLNRDLYEWISKGTNLHRFKRHTQTSAAKIDYTDQVSRLHQVKVGVEGRSHRLYLEDYNLVQSDANPDVPAIPLSTSPLYEEYTQNPLEFSAYAQDKLEYEHMVVNIGVRFDYFNSRGKVLTDLQDPNVYDPQKEENKALTLDQRLAKWYKKATAKYSVSPRFGISYPITDRGILHFSYGHFLQIPPFQYLYQKPGYKVTTASGVQGTYGNPDLKPQKTVMYEFGLQQQLTEDLSFDVTGFYRDTRDWVTTTAPIPVRDPVNNTSSYVMYTNRDYQNARGVTLSVAKRPSSLWSLQFAYTFQSAESNYSNPDDELAALNSNQEPARSLNPSDWDQRHTANVTVGVGQQDWGVFVLARYGSGLPYTPALNQAEESGEDVARTVQKNSRRQPETYTVDLRLFKNFTIQPLTLSVFLRVFNLFDRRNETTVYGQTGRATASVGALGAGNITSTSRINPVEAYIVRPDYYSEPREIQLGVEMSF